MWIVLSFNLYNEYATSNTHFTTPCHYATIGEAAVVWFLRIWEKCCRESRASERWRKENFLKMMGSWFRETVFTMFFNDEPTKKHAVSVVRLDEKYETSQKKLKCFNIMTLLLICLPIREILAMPSWILSRRLYPECFQIKSLLKWIYLK